MSEVAGARTEIDRFDPGLTRLLVELTRPITKRYFRAELRGLDNIPAGPCLVVGNHSGGIVSPDMSVFAVGYYDRYGYHRPLYTLAHDMALCSPAAGLMKRTGVIHATRENAAAALASGAVVMVYPGGEHELYRPTASRNKISFGGHTGYVTTAIEAGAPIVPVVSIGAHEAQLFLIRGERLSRALGLTKLEYKIARTRVLPITFGFPFGFSILAVPVNVPLPTKVVTQVLPVIDIAGRFGDDPDVDEVDEYVRSVMQAGLDDLGRHRRLPILG